MRDHQLLNGLLNAYQEASVDYYKLNNKVDSITALIIAKEMYITNFEEIISILERNKK